MSLVPQALFSPASYHLRSRDIPLINLIFFIGTYVVVKPPNNFFQRSNFSSQRYTTNVLSLVLLGWTNNHSNPAYFSRPSSLAFILYSLSIIIESYLIFYIFEKTTYRGGPSNYTLHNNCAPLVTNRIICGFDTLYSV